MRTNVYDIVRDRREQAYLDYLGALVAEDFEMANVTVGEVIGQIADVRPAADLVRTLVDDASRRLGLHAAGV